MKTYLLSLPSQLKSFNAKLDVKGALCGKSWVVFNDEGVRQLFIFNTNGSLLISNNGKVINSSWQFIPANSSIIITADNETIMFKPGFYDNIIFVLKQDGLERFLFMIDENNTSLMPDMTLRGLKQYLEDKAFEIIKQDPEYIAARKREWDQKQKKEIEQKKQEEERIRKEEERKQLAQEEANMVSYVVENKEKLLHNYERQKRVSAIVFPIALMISVGLLIGLFNVEGILKTILGIVLAFGIVATIASYSMSKQLFEEFVKNEYERDKQVHIQFHDVISFKEIWDKHCKQ